MKPRRDNGEYGPAIWAHGNRMVDIVNPVPRITPRQRKKIAEAYEYNMHWGLGVAELASEFGLTKGTIFRVAKRWFAEQGKPCPRHTTRKFY